MDGIINSVRMIALLIFLLLFSGCSDRFKPHVSDDGLTEKVLGAYAQAMCDKMIYCYKPVYRTMSPELQNQISVDECVKVATANLKKNAALHSPMLKMFALSCYDDLLAGSCDTIAQDAIMNPSCLQMRMTAIKVSKEYRK